MNVWQELGIVPTAEVREIRRAYAQRLRHTHPEDDPEGFHRLRAAYESAMASAAPPPLPGEMLRSVSVSDIVPAVETKCCAIDDAGKRSAQRQLKPCIFYRQSDSQPIDRRLARDYTGRHDIVVLRSTS